MKKRSNSLFPSTSKNTSIEVLFLAHILEYDNDAFYNVNTRSLR